jgi:hypothetical protein
MMTRTRDSTLNLAPVLKHQVLWSDAVSILASSPTINVIHKHPCIDIVASFRIDCSTIRQAPSPPIKGSVAE